MQPASRLSRRQSISIRNNNLQSDSRLVRRQSISIKNTGFTVIQKPKQFQLQTSQRQAFLEIFNMYTKQGTIDQKDLVDIFERIGFYVQKRHFQQICAKIFDLKDRVNFEEFMQVFKVKNSAHDLLDIKNAFRLIAGDQDQYIPLSKLIEILKKQDIDNDRVEDLVKVLDRYIDHKKKLFDFKLFLSHLH